MQNHGREKVPSICVQFEIRRPLRTGHGREGMSRPTLQVRHLQLQMRRLHCEMRRFKLTMGHFQCEMPRFKLTMGRLHCEMRRFKLTMGRLQGEMPRFQLTMGHFQCEMRRFQRPKAVVWAKNGVSREVEPRRERRTRRQEGTRAVAQPGTGLLSLLSGSVFFSVLSVVLISRCLSGKRQREGKGGWRDGT